MRTRAIVKLEEKCFGTNSFVFYRWNYIDCSNSSTFSTVYEGIRHRNYSVLVINYSQIVSSLFKMSTIFPVWNTIPPTRNSLKNYLVLDTIGPLQDLVTWHGINYAGTQMT